MLETFNYAYKDVIAAVEVSIACNDDFNYMPSGGNVIEDNGKYYFDMKVDISQPNPLNPDEDVMPEIITERIPMNVDYSNQRMMDTIKKAIKYPQHTYKTVFYEYGIPAVSLIFYKGNEDFALRMQEEEAALEYFRFLGIDTEDDLNDFMKKTKKQAMESRNC